MWRIELLGGVRVGRAGNWVRRFETRRAAQLLARLAVVPGRVQPRELLTELLWPEEDPEATRIRFRQVLFSLRRSLAEVGAGDLIESDRLSVALRPGACETDVGEFESLLREEGSAEKRQARLRRAADLYQGEFLPGHYEDWVVTERERLAEAFCRALEELAAAELAGGRPEEASALARRAVAADPLREAAQALLLRALVAEGRPGEARRQYRTFEQLLWKELRALPSDDTRGILSEAAAPAAEGVAPAPPAAGLPRGNLAAPLTRFFGREPELEWLTAQLHPAGDGPRLVSVVGPAGSGKSRVALEAGHRLRGAYEGAVWFVGVEGSTDAGTFGPALVAALGLPVVEHDPLAALAGAVGVEPALLIVDNFEGVGAAGAPVLQSLLERYPAVRLLVTSRVALQAPGEAQWLLDPLPTPGEEESVVALEGVPSVQLFVDRARLARASFALTDANAHWVGEICRRLEGLPLAMELAAAWVPMLSPEQLARRLSDRFALLVSPRTDLDRRHRSLRATVEWSFQQLDPAERALFTGLSVFRGGWTLAAVESVCAGLAPDLLSALAGLQRRSMVQLDESPAEPRFRLLETLRDYAAQQLPPDLAAAVQRRHALYFAGLAERAEPELVGPDQTEWTETLHRDRNNLRAAVEWSLLPGAELEVGFRTAAALGRYFEVRQRLREADTLLEPLLARRAEVNPAIRARLLEAAGNLAINRGRMDRAEPLLTEARGLYETLGDDFARARAQCSLGISAREREEFEPARALLESTLPTIEAAGDAYEIARLCGALGVLERHAGRGPQARVWLERSSAMFRVCGHKRRMAWCHYQQARVAELEEKPALAEALYRDALASFRDVDDPSWILFSLQDLARVAAEAGRPGEAVTLAQAALVECRRLGAEEWSIALGILLGDFLRQGGDPAAGRARHVGAARAALDAGLPAHLAVALDHLAAGLADEPETALTLLGASETHTMEPALLGGGRPVFFVADRDALRAALSPETAEAALFRGRHLDPDSLRALLVELVAQA